MRDVFRQRRFYFCLELVVEHVCLGDCKHPVLDEQFGVIFLEFVEQDFITFPDVVLVSCYHEQQDGVALNMSEETHSDALAFMCALDDARDVSHYE